MVAAAAAAYWMLTDSTFKLDAPNVSGDLRFVDAQQVVGATLPSDHPNVLLLNTDSIREQLMSQPAIEDATVTVTLPSRLDVALTERTPVFGLVRGASAMLIDGNGVPMDLVDVSRAQQLSLPLVSDERSAPPTIYTGIAIDPIELGAILQIGAVSPALLDSQAQTFELSIRDDDGFVVTAEPQGWQAIFGQYTPNLRPTDIIPRQVQCLRSLVESSEADLKTVYLSPLDDRCGTYLPLATPSVPTPAPSKSR